MLYNILRKMFLITFKVFYRLKVEGIEHVPKDGAVILCSNHISNFDPPLVGSPLKRKVSFMAKSELFEVPLLKNILPSLNAFPIKRGGVSRESIRLTLRLLEEGKMLCIFPQGTRSNTLETGQKGAASFALKSGATVVPVAIIGEYRLFSRMMIRYGAPVDLSGFSEKASSEELEEATNRIMQAIRELRDRPN